MEKKIIIKYAGIVEPQELILDLGKSFEIVKNNFGRRAGIKRILHNSQGVLNIPQNFLLSELADSIIDGNKVIEKIEYFADSILITSVGAVLDIDYSIQDLNDPLNPANSYIIETIRFILE